MKCPRCRRRPSAGDGRGLLVYCDVCRPAAARELALLRWSRRPGPREVRARALLATARELDRLTMAGGNHRVEVEEAERHYRRALQAFVRAEVSG